MASLSSHITDEHNDERDVPQLKVKRYTCSRQPFITDFLIFKQMPFYMLWYSLKKTKKNSNDMFMDVLMPHFCC